MIQRYRGKMVNGKPELILIEEIDSMITIQNGDLTGVTYEESEIIKPKIKKVKVYPYLIDKDMRLVTGKWYQKLWVDIKVYFRKLKP